MNKILIEVPTWLGDCVMATASIENIIKATWKLGSIPHHPSSSLGYFNRADAEAIMLVTTALLTYVGKLLKQAEER